MGLGCAAHKESKDRDRDTCDRMVIMVLVNAQEIHEV